MYTQIAIVRKEPSTNTRFDANAAPSVFVYKNVLNLLFEISTIWKDEMWKYDISRQLINDVFFFIVIGLLNAWKQVVASFPKSEKFPQTLERGKNSINFQKNY